MLRCTRGGSVRRITANTAELAYSGACQCTGHHPCSVRSRKDRIARCRPQDLIDYLKAPKKMAGQGPHTRTETQSRGWGLSHRARLYHLCR